MIYFVLGFTIIAITALIVIIIQLFIHYRSIKYMYNELNSDYLYVVTKFSMVEYEYRKYKEGKNPITTLRDIGDLIYSGFRKKYTD